MIAHGPAALMRGAFLAGCADYLRDPWTPEELALRAHAAVSRQVAGCEFPWGEMRFDGDKLRTPGGPAALTHHEAVILRALLRQRGTPVPRAALACLLGGGAPRGAGEPPHRRARLGPPPARARGRSRGRQVHRLRPRPGLHGAVTERMADRASAAHALP